MYILDKILKPAAEAFCADFYLVDVGFDGHEEDHLSRINLDDQFYEWVAVEMMDIAGSLTLILEGGYDLNALSSSNKKLINGLQNYKIIKEENEKDNQDSHNSQVKDQTKNIYQEIKETFSPYFDL